MCLRAGFGLEVGQRVRTVAFATHATGWGEAGEEGPNGEGGEKWGRREALASGEENEVTVKEIQKMFSLLFLTEEKRTVRTHSETDPPFLATWTFQKETKHK
jgi:hypothetical protein